MPRESGIFHKILRKNDRERGRTHKNPQKSRRARERLASDRISCYNVRMLTILVPQWKQKHLFRGAEDFFRSPFYVALIVALMVTGAVFSAELYVYILYFLLGAAGLLLSSDALPVVPIACCAYMTVSPPNNPIKFPGTTIFEDPAFFATVDCLILGLAALLILRFAIRIISRASAGERIRRPRLLTGFACLGLSYLAGGLFTEGFGGKNILFSLLQILSLSLLYFLIIYTVDWERVPKDYLPSLFVLIGIGMAAEVARMYCNDGVFTAEGVFRDNLFLGWGVYNNVACIASMCIPAPCYFAVTRRGPGGAIFSVLFYLSTLLTQSRGGILFGTVVFAACVIYVLRKGKGNRLANLAVYACFLLAAAIAALVFRARLAELFASLIRVGLDSSNRFTLYRDCWNAFVAHPFFGVGFYNTPGFAFNSVGGFMSPRAHNTFFQITASCGMFGLFAYAYHRFQTVDLLLRNRTPLKMFAFFALCAMVLTSLLDCHLFNFGPPIICCALFSFAEGEDLLREKKHALCERLEPPQMQWIS